MKNNYILITGGAGYIGSTVANYLLNRKYKILILDNLSSGKKSFINKKSKFIKVDLLNYNSLNKKIFKYKISHIIHLASNIDVTESEIYPKKYLNDNVKMTKNILKFAIKYKIKNFIFSSTAAVYGKSNKTKVNEKDQLKPISNYGLGKLICENLIIDECKNNNIKYTILRYFNVVGADIFNKTGPLKKGSLFKNLSENLEKNKNNINVYGKNFKTPDGSAIRDYIDVLDIANIHYLIIKNLKEKNIIINCSYSKPLSVLKVIKLFSQISKTSIKINYSKRRKGEIPKIYADNVYLKKLFKTWKPKKNVYQSIKTNLFWEKYLNN